MRQDFLYPTLQATAPLSDDSLENLGAFLPVESLEAYVADQRKLNLTDDLWRFGHEFFQDENGDPWDMAPGELALFTAIARREYPRVQVVTSTQYGKSLTVSRAVLTRIVTFAEDWLIVVPDLKRGQILLDYMIQDSSRNEYFKDKLVSKELGKRDALNRLLEEKSKVKLTFQIVDGTAITGYGSVTLLTANAKRKQDAITSIMGFGGRNIIADEAALEDDDIDAGIFRMMAGKGEDTFLCKIGNPFFRNHFLETWKDPTYKKVFVDYQIALAEGRYTESFIAEARKKPQFEVLYGCAFPSDAAMDTRGWMPLFTNDEIRIAQQEAVHFGDDRIGADPADQGVNESAIVRRSAGYAEITFAQPGVDPMDFTGQIVVTSDTITQQRPNWKKEVFVDRVGVGAGVYSRLNEVNRVEKSSKLSIFGVNAGETAASKQFSNKRAEMYWRIREWIKGGGKLKPDERWYQLCTVKYRANSSGAIEMKPKILMAQQDGNPSPDVADALSMTFYNPASAMTAISPEDKFFLKKMLQNKRESRKVRPQGF